MRESELFRLPVLVSLITLTTACLAAEPASVVAPGAKLVKVEGTYEFTEGPAADANGNVYFSDVRAARCYYWTTDGKVTLWREDTGNANGQAIDRSGNLLACEGGRGRVVSLDPQRHVTVVADQYQGKRFNQPNDLWIDPHHGVYFTDPIYGRGEKPQVVSNLKCNSNASFFREMHGC
jgi:gluconolactonase